MEMPVVVVGAGVSGLACAGELCKEGVSVVVLDAGESIGGRLGSDSSHGYRFDRGAQIVFGSGPQEWRLQPFEPGVLVFHKGRLRRVFADDAFELVLSRFLPIGDVVKLADLLRNRPEPSGPDSSALAYLSRLGVSERALDRLLRPLFGALFLGAGLGFSARQLLALLDAFADGGAGYPAEGMQAIPGALGESVTTEALRLGVAVEGIAEGTARISGGEEIEGRAFVVATPADVAARLTGVPHRCRYASTTRIDFDAPGRPLFGRYLVVSAEPGVVSHVIPVSNFSASSAPEGRHLVSVALRPEANPDAPRFAERLRRELDSMFAGTSVAQWRPLRRTTVRQPLFAPGDWEAARPLAAAEGVWVVGDAAGAHDLRSAIDAGRACAQAWLDVARRAAA